ncbi:MAG: FAD/NAD(P)-binding protein [Gammaproteobacteria bacterium]|nr:FAD/NAD(P)-binding protein [Gammaproteobacteria bacterium]
MSTTNPYLPLEAEVVDRLRESDTIFTLRLKLTDPDAQRAYGFQPGQFNMVYLYGVGEVAISIVSDPEYEDLLDHTIRIVGRVTRGLAKLRRGDRLGIRGPYGRGWPLDRTRGRAVTIVTGGLGCAPVVSVISYVLKRRAEFGRLTIIQGVKHSADLIWRQRYIAWSELPDVQVLLAADQGSAHWPWHVGLVTELLDQAPAAPGSTIYMMCGPEIMMRNAARILTGRGHAETDIYLSMERNMQCALGHCGHCQYGAPFVCREGPVFDYGQVKTLLGSRGF